MIRFDNVGMRYGSGDEVLRDISFELPRGSFHFLTGRSGAGKSSLLKLMYLSERPSRGLISMMGVDIVTARRNALPRLRRNIGVVFQDYRLIDHLSAYDNVALPLRISGATKAEVRDYVEELLVWVGLKDRMNSRPSILSGGEQQRVAIARAVINRPSVLLADEPTGNVDDEMAARLLRLFIELNRLGTTTVIATHDMDLVDSIEVPRLHLEAGHLVQLPPGIDPPDDLPNAPSLPEAFPQAVGFARD